MAEEKQTIGDKVGNAFRAARRGAKKTAIRFSFFILKCVFFAIIFFYLTFFILWLRESGKKDELAGVCYYDLEFGRSIVFNLDTKKIKGHGHEAKMNEFGKIGMSPNWIDTKIEATGGYLEIFVTGEWYPVGKNSTLKRREVTDLGLNDTTEIQDVGYQRCDLSDDLADDYGPVCRYGNDKVTGNCRYLESHEEEFQPLKRYDRFSGDGNKAKIYQQNGYIHGYHIADKEVILNNEVPHRYNDIYAGLQGDEVSQKTFNCALANGYGVYMRLGNDVQVAYHLANKGVARQKVLSDGNYIVNDVDNKSQRIVDIMPFTLPTTMYDTSFLLTGDESRYQGVTTSPFTNVIDKNSTTWSDVEFYGNCENGAILGSANATNDLESVNNCEFGYPRDKQRIYVTISTSDYSLQDGRVVLRFKRGARYVNDRDIYIMRTIWEKITEGVFGINVYTGTLSDDGLVVTFRNALLTSASFQALAYMLLMMSVMYFGYQMIIGDAAVNIKVILNKFIAVGFGVWILNPDHHQLFDHFLTPLFLKGVDNLVSMVINAMMQNIGMSGDALSSDNPFVAFDAIVSDLFGEVTMAKLLGMFYEGNLFYLMPMIILTINAIVALQIIRSSSIYMLAQLGLAISFMLMPIAALGLMFAEKYRDKFDNMIKGLVNKTISSGTSLIGFSMLVAFLLYYLKKLFHFTVCFGKAPLLKWIPTHGWVVKGDLDPNKFLYNLALMVFIIYMANSLKQYIASMIESIFGKDGDEGFAEKAFNKSFDNTIGGASQVVGGITQKHLGVNIGVSSKELADPTKLAGRAISGVMDVTSSPINKLEDYKMKKVDEAYKAEDARRKAEKEAKKAGGGVVNNLKDDKKSDKKKDGKSDSGEGGSDEGDESGDGDDKDGKKRGDVNSNAFNEEDKKDSGDSDNGLDNEGGGNEEDNDESGDIGDEVSEEAFDGDGNKIFNGEGRGKRNNKQGPQNKGAVGSEEYADLNQQTADNMLERGGISDDPDFFQNKGVFGQEEQAGLREQTMANMLERGGVVIDGKLPDDPDLQQYIMSADEFANSNAFGAAEFLMSAIPPELQDGQLMDDLKSGNMERIAHLAGKYADEELERFAESGMPKFEDNATESERLREENEEYIRTSVIGQAGSDAIGVGQGVSIGESQNQAAAPGQQESTMQSIGDQGQVDNDKDKHKKEIEKLEQEKKKLEDKLAQDKARQAKEDYMFKDLKEKAQWTKDLAQFLMDNGETMKNINKLEGEAFERVRAEEVQKAIDFNKAHNKKPGSDGSISILEIQKGSGAAHIQAMITVTGLKDTQTSQRQQKLGKGIDKKNKQIKDLGGEK